MGSDNLENTFLYAGLPMPQRLRLVVPSLRAIQLWNLTPIDPSQVSIPRTEAVKPREAMKRKTSTENDPRSMDRSHYCRLAIHAF